MLSGIKKVSKGKSNCGVYYCHGRHGKLNNRNQCKHLWKITTENRLPVYFQEGGTHRKEYLNAVEGSIKAKKQAQEENEESKRTKRKRKRESIRLTKTIENLGGRPRIHPV